MFYLFSFIANTTRFRVIALINYANYAIFFDISVYFANYFIKRLLGTQVTDEIFLYFA